MAKFNHCFIKDENGYHEIPYSELLSNGKKSPSYIGRFFLPYGDCLMEVSEEDYVEEYKNRRHIKYLWEEAKLWGEVSYHALDSDELCGEETIKDISTDVEAEAISSVTVSTTMQGLTDNEQRLVTLLCSEELTERECAKIFNISQKGINKRKHKIRLKLKKNLEN